MTLPVANPNTPANNPSFSSSTCKTYGFILAIILGLGGLAVAAVGVTGYFQVGALSNLDQVHAIAMMATGGSMGILLLSGVIIRSIRNCLDKSGSSVQANKLSEAFKTRCSSSSWLNIISASPIANRELFKQAHPLQELELQEEVFEISKAHTEKIENLFSKIQINYRKLFRRNRENLNYQVEFYDIAQAPSCRNAFREFFEFLTTKAGGIASPNDETELIEMLTNLLPCCKWKPEEKEFKSVSLNFLKDMITLAVVGRIHKANYWHYLHVIGNCGHLD